MRAKRELDGGVAVELGALRQAQSRRPRHRAPPAAACRARRAPPRRSPKMRCPARCRQDRAGQHRGLVRSSEASEQSGDRAQHRPLRRPHPGTTPVDDEAPVVLGSDVRIAQPGFDRRLRRPGDAGDERRASQLGQLGRLGEAKPRPIHVDGELGLPGAVPHVRRMRCARVADLGEQHRPPGPTPCRRRRRPGRAAPSLSASVARPDRRRRRGGAPIPRHGVGELAFEEGVVAPHHAPRRREVAGALGHAHGPRAADTGLGHVAGHPRGVRGDRPHWRRQRAAVLGVDREDPLGPGQDFGAEAKHPVVGQSDDQPPGEFDLPVVDQPVERNAQLWQGSVDVGDRAVPRPAAGARTSIHST